MGGSIFPNTVRLSQSAYLAFKTHVLAALSSPSTAGQLAAFPPSALAVPPYLSPKTSFGDLDVIAAPDGWTFAKDGSANWAQGDPSVREDGVSGRAGDWAERLGAIRWQRRGPIVSFAVPLDVFHRPGGSPSSIASTSSPPVAQVDLILIASQAHIPLETMILSYSGLGILLSRPLRYLSTRQLVLSHASLTLVHDFTSPVLFGTSITVPVPPLEMALSCDVPNLCATLGLDHTWWIERARGERKVVHEEIFEWVMGVQGGLIRQGWDQILSTHDIVEVVDSTVTMAANATAPLLDLVKRDPSRPPKASNSRTRARLRVPLFQAFLSWLKARATPLSPSSPSSLPAPPPAFSRLEPATYHLLTALSSFDSEQSLAEKYLALLATHEKENDALVRRRRTNLALSGTKVKGWFPEIPMERLNSVTSGVRDKVGEDWLVDEGRTEDEVKVVVGKVWDEEQRRLQFGDET